MFNETKQLRIPKEFTLFGHKYSVVVSKDLFDKEQCYGTADEDGKVITLQDLGVVTKRYEEDGKQCECPVVVTENIMIETFFHEVVHIILETTGEELLSENEKFVNMTGKAWLEIYLSSVYEKDSS